MTASAPPEQGTTRLCTELLYTRNWGGREWAEESIAKKRKEKEKKTQLPPKNAGIIIRMNGMEWNGIKY